MHGSWLAEACTCVSALSAVSMSGAPSTEVMMMFLRLSCLAARSVPMACGSLMANTASTFGKRVRWFCITLRPPSREPLASWSSDSTLMSGLFFEHRLAAVDAIDHRRDLRAVLDDHVALAAELLDDELAGDLAGLHVVGLHGRVGAVGRHVDAHHHDAGLLGLLQRGLDGLGVDRVDEDHVDPRGDEAVDLRELLVEVVVGRQRRDLDGRVVAAWPWPPRPWRARRRRDCRASRA